MKLLPNTCKLNNTPSAEMVNNLWQSLNNSMYKLHLESYTPVYSRYIHIISYYICRYVYLQITHPPILTCIIVFCRSMCSHTHSCAGTRTHVHVYNYMSVSMNTGIHIIHLHTRLHMCTQYF